MEVESIDGAPAGSGSADAYAAASAGSAARGPRNIAQLFPYRQGDQAEHNTQHIEDRTRMDFQ